MKRAIALLIATLLTGTLCYAQQDSVPPAPREYVSPQQSEVVLKDGNVLRGYIKNQNDSTVLFSSPLTGQVSIPRSTILEIKSFNPNSTGNQQVYINLGSRYFYSPSGINMKKGDGYYQNIWVSLNSFNYALTNHFTVGGGFELYTLLAGKPIFFFTAKANTDISENLHLGAGYLHFNYSLLFNREDGKANSLNLVFGSVTLGNADHNLTVNAGSDLSRSGSPVVTVCGFTRTGPHFGLMTENWIFTGADNYTLYSFGGRVIGRKNFFDFGLITNRDIVLVALGIPFLSYTLRF